jgi:hypothetical protein
MKEYRVYFLQYPEISGIDSDEIKKWHEQEVLCEDALNFISLAEEKGYVFSVVNMFNLINEGEINVEQFYYFVTNKY